MQPFKYDYNKRLITSTVITLGGFHCITLGQQLQKVTKNFFFFLFFNLDFFQQCDCSFTFEQANICSNITTTLKNLKWKKRLKNCLVRPFRKSVQKKKFFEKMAKVCIAIYHLRKHFMQCTLFWNYLCWFTKPR